MLVEFALPKVDYFDDLVVYSARPSCNVCRRSRWISRFSPGVGWGLGAEADVMSEGRTA
jgi:hypothetical protein